MHAQSTTPGGLAAMLQLSPKSIERVKKAEAGGVRRSTSSASPDPKCRNRFMERVTNCYTPIVEELLSRPLFDGGTTPRPDRVAQQIVKKISKRYKGEAIAKGRRGCPRKLIYNEKDKTKTTEESDPELDDHMKDFLRDMAGSWRQVRLTLNPNPFLTFYPNPQPEPGPTQLRSFCSRRYCPNGVEGHTEDQTSVRLAWSPIFRRSGGDECRLSGKSLNARR